MGEEAETQLTDDRRRMTAFKTVVGYDVSDKRWRTKFLDQEVFEHRLTATERRRRRRGAGGAPAVTGGLGDVRHE